MIIKPQLGKQEEFIACDADIVLYGGSAGAGKSFAILLDSVRYLDVKNFNAIYFRKHAVELEMPGGLWSESGMLYPHLQGTPQLQYHRWKFKKSSLTFAHLSRPEDLTKWQGSQICGIYFDELTHFSWEEFSYLLSRNRSVCGVKPYIRATCNPDKDSWVRQFIDWYIDEQGFAIPERSGVIRYFVRKGEEIIWGNTTVELCEHMTEDELRLGAKPKSFTFISAKLSDNQILMHNDPNYLSNLLALNKIEREKLLDGNWNSSYNNMGEVINRKDFTRYNLQEKLNIPGFFAESYFVIDSASTVKTSSDYSVIMFIAKDRNNGIYIIDIIREKLEEPDLEQKIIDVWNYWKNVMVGCNFVFGIKGINIEAKSSGISMIQRLGRKNMPVYELNPDKDKFLRLNDGLGLIKNGIVHVPDNASWTETFFEECENFRANLKHVTMRNEKLPHDDQVDALAYAIGHQVNIKTGVKIYVPPKKQSQVNTLHQSLYGMY